MDNFHSNPQTVSKRTSTFLSSSDGKDLFPKQEGRLLVFMRGVTWIRDSHGLFDYESRSINKKSFKIQGQGKVVRMSNDVDFYQLHKKDEDIGLEAQTLFLLKQEPEGFTLENAPIEPGMEDKEDSENRLWVVIRSLKSPEGRYDYKINKFDTLKLGRIKFRVKDLSCPGIDQTRAELKIQELKEAKGIESQETSEENFCRICYSHEQSQENPCIIACRCSGSVGLIHFNCLKHWLSTKMVKKEDRQHLQSYYWKNFECEICKSAYPYSFKVKDNLYKLFEVGKPTSDKFIMLESLPLDKNSSR